MKKNILFAVIAIVLFVGGFVAGMEYKAYQIRTALEQAFKPTSSATNQSASPTSSTADSNSIMTQAKNEGKQITDVKVGDEVTLATMKYKVTSVTEQQTLAAPYGSPKTADAGTKFAVISMEITNTTNSQFALSPDDTFTLVDNKKREFQTYSGSIGALDNELTYQTLPPSETQTGVLIYEVPTDATQYGLLAFKAGSNKGYMVVLK
jgi:cytoskeletal protein RodZ